jgi:hypothetical protein
MDKGEAIETDGKPGNIEKRFAADAAIGRKEDGKETLGNATGPDFINPRS